MKLRTPAKGAHWFSAFVKRSFDVVASFFALLFLSPILTLVAILIKIDSKGPIFFVSKRVGAQFKVFPMIKFRTMYQDADKRLADLVHLNQYAIDAEKDSDEPRPSLEKCVQCEQLGEPCSPLMLNGNEVVCERLLKKAQQDGKSAFVKIMNDPRITRIGRILRKTSIDELPQLINVFRGDMSFVGNRPLPMYEAQQLTKDSSIARFMAPAGLTGLWQITKRGKSDMSEQERIDLDNHYAENHSLLLDTQILFKTIPALLQAEDV